MTPAAPRKRWRLRLIFVLLVLVSLWRLVQRPWKQAAESSLSQEPGHQAAPEAETKSAPQAENGRAPLSPAPAPAPPQPEPEMATPIASPEPATPYPELNPVDLRYAVKWVDGSDGADVPHEKRDLTLRQAQREAGWLAKHNRRFYPGEASEGSPFSRLQVWLQCVCGRDVVDLREPHTTPGEDRTCPYSGSGQSLPQDVILASR
jgi:hypothetical protein